MSASRPAEQQGVRPVTLQFEGFAWEALEAEAEREGSTIEELIAFSVLYYLADVDSGRIARQYSRSPHRESSDSSPAGAPPEPAAFSPRFSDRD